MSDTVSGNASQHEPERIGFIHEDHIVAFSRDILMWTMARGQVIAFDRAYKAEDWNRIRELAGCGSKKDIVNRAIGLGVRSMREARGLTEQQMARKLHISKESLVLLEEDGNWSGPKQIMAALRVFECRSIPLFLHEAFGKKLTASFLIRSVADFVMRQDCTPQMERFVLEYLNDEVLEPAFRRGQALMPVTILGDLKQRSEKLDPLSEEYEIISLLREAFENAPALQTKAHGLAILMHRELQSRRSDRVRS